MAKLKTEDEIISQLESVKRDIEHYRAERDNGKITEEFWIMRYRELSTMSNTLRWVLGGNDRYD